MECQNTGGKYGLMFSERFTHSLVAQGVRHVHRMKGDGHFEPVSAGFVDPTTFAVSGMSESLGLNHHKNDGAYLWGGDSVAMLPVEMVVPLFHKWQNEKEFG
jgi:hypothetical protein